MSEIFTGEHFTIDKLLTVFFFDSDLETTNGKTIHYKANLPHYELIYNTTGGCTVFFDGKVFFAGADQIIYLPKGVNASEHITRYDLRTTGIDIYFDTTAPMPQEALLFKKPGLDMKNKFTRLYNIWSSKGADYYQRSIATMYEIIISQRLSQRKYINTTTSQRLDIAIEYINKNCTKQDIDYLALAEMTGLSYSYFKSLFVKTYGMPPSKYVLSMKIKYAKELLVTNRYSVTTVAEMCGFSNIYYFSRVFKEITGISPSKFTLIEQ